MQELKELKLTAPQKAIVRSRQQINLFLAGQGSGKTHLAGVISAYLVSNFPKAIGIVAANTYDQLNRSTMFRIRQVWKDYFGVEEYTDYNPSGVYVVGKKPPAHFIQDHHSFERYNNIISFVNGGILFTGSLDNYKALDGQEATWAILDETKDSKEEAVKEVIIGRLRQQSIWINNGELNKDGKGSSFNPLYIITSPAKVEWINDWFELEKFEDEIKDTIFSKVKFFECSHKNKSVVISSTFHNQENLPDNYITNQVSNLTPELQEMLVYGSPFSKSGGEFYKHFNRDKHIKDNDYDPSLPLHISFDENVHPYLTCTVWQIKEKKAMQIDEICLSSPQNTVKAVCNEFKKRYPIKSGLFIYGDRTSKKEDTKLEKGSNFFTIIQQELREYTPSTRLPNRNPPVVMRGNFMNMIFYNNFQDIIIEIHSKCNNSIGDFTYLKEASDGTKLKEKAKNPQTGVTYEKRGHTSDSAEYLICQVFKTEFYTYINGNKPATNYKAGDYADNSKKRY